MSSWEFELVDPPSEPRARELWLQHAAGFILFQDVREYAQSMIPTDTDPAERAAALQSIDDAVYGLMKVIDGVTGGLQNERHRLGLKVEVELERADTGEVIERLDLGRGDGVTMGFHMWTDGDFGEHPIARASRPDA